MKREIHDLIQGSPEWHAFRSSHFGASEASAMLGISPYKTRSELIREKALGIVPDVSPALQRVFDKGHETEALARPIVEALIGDELFPATYSFGRLSASCDGLNMLGDVMFEHKQWHEELAASLAAGVLPEHHMPQCQQGLYVTGAEKLLFVCSDGTTEKMQVLWVLPDPAWPEKLEAGWRQFEADVANYIHREPEPVAEAAPIEALPALFVQLVGEVRDSNIAVFRDAALRYIDTISTDLQTDDDFARAELDVKFCDDAEKKIRLVKEAALAQTASIDQLFKALDLLAESMRQKRLALEKLVKAKKEAKRAEIISEATDALNAYVEAINARLQTVRLPAIHGGFAEAVKGKKTLSGCRDAVSDALAAAKIKADQTAIVIGNNLLTLAKYADYDFLFADVANLAGKAPDDLQAVIDSRIAKHKAAEEAKLEAEREKVRAEERAKAEAEVLEKARIEQQRIAEEQAAERRRKAEEDQGRQIEEARRFRESIAPVQPVAVAVPETDVDAEILVLMRRLNVVTRRKWLHYGYMLEQREAA